MNKREEGKSRPRFLESLFPRQRPKHEWEHVYVTRNGTRYVDVKELLADERVKALIRKAAEVEVESPRRNATAAYTDEFSMASVQTEAKLSRLNAPTVEHRGQDGGDR